MFNDCGEAGDEWLLFYADKSCICADGEKANFLATGDLMVGCEKQKMLEQEGLMNCPIP